MARYHFVGMSPRLLPVVLDDQSVPGSFAHVGEHDCLRAMGARRHERQAAWLAPCTREGYCREADRSNAMRAQRRRMLGRCC